MEILTFSEFQTDLHTLARELTNNINDENWLRFVYLAPLVLFDDIILRRITELSSRAEIAGGNTRERRLAIAHLAQLAHIAVAQRHAALGEAILARCLEAVGP